MGAKGKKELRDGLTKHRFFGKWQDMMNRCYNPKDTTYRHYGGRGIRVSEEFQNRAIYLAFLDELPGYGIEGRTQIDRIENDGHYERGNLRWANRTEQLYNRRAFHFKKEGGIGTSFQSHLTTKKWRASVMVNYKYIHIGLFKTHEEASAARNKYLIDNKLIQK